MRCFSRGPQLARAGVLHTIQAFCPAHTTAGFCCPVRALTTPSWRPKFRAPTSMAHADAANALGSITQGTELLSAATVTGPYVAAPLCQHLDAASAPQALLSKQISTVIFDCDGVLWRGDELIPNATQALDVLRAQGKRILFVTNNSSKSRAAYVKKFTALGIQAVAEEIVSSSFAAAAYLRSIDFSRSVLLLGQTGVEEELTAAGISYIGGSTGVLPLLDSPERMRDAVIDPSVGAVVVGWDPAFSYSRIVYASLVLREVPGAFLVATNLDAADRLHGRRMMPGTGGLVAAVEAAAGVTAINVGKGGPWLLPFLCSYFNLDPAHTAIVGDRLDTDIALGRSGGLVTILPLTGVCQEADLLEAPADQLPMYVIPSVAALGGLL